MIATKHLASAHLKLQPSGSGWSLVDPQGRLRFYAPGLRGRRRCLEFARASGALTLIS